VARYQILHRRTTATVWDKLKARTRFFLKKDTDDVPDASQSRAATVVANPLSNQALSNQSPKELVSVSGKRIFAGRDKRAGVASKANFAFEGDKSRARNAANSGHSATIREISVRARPPTKRLSAGGGSRRARHCVT